MDYEYEDPAAADAADDDADNQQDAHGDDEAMDVDHENGTPEEEEDIPVTQEDAWAVIR
jgi:hypothetical protein